MRSRNHLLYLATLAAFTILLSGFGVNCYPEYSATMTFYEYPAPRGAKLRESIVSGAYNPPQRSTHSRPPSVVVARQFAAPSLESAAFTMALTRQGYVVATDAHAQHNSQNVKLPVPLGISPISFAPLPLQAGAPYSTVHGVTSYGTPYPQRRRR